MLIKPIEMAEVLHHPSVHHLALDPDRNSPGPVLRAYGTPEPNPPFVFPIHPTKPDPVDSIERASNLTVRRGKNPINRPRPQQLSLNNTSPVFQFPPSTASSAGTINTSPERSPTKTTSILLHSSGHRRNGSEFIGGDGRSGGFGLMSSSPTKGEGTLPPPSTSRTGPPMNKRGHAHRRSGAISSHDLSTILKPSEPRGSSAPTTPSISTTQNLFPPDLERAISQPIPIIPTITRQEPSIAINHYASSSFEGQQRPRVGFSETLEFIPRPLSTISSETSSSLSTVRPNHSLTGSITSIISAGTSSPPSVKVNRSALDTMFEVDLLQPRPKTASPTVPRYEQRVQFQEDRTILNRPSSASNVEGTPEGARNLDSWGNSSQNSWSEETPSAHSQPFVHTTRQGDQVLPPDSSDSQFCGQPPKYSANTTPSRPRTSLEPTRAKKQRKVKAWAGSILSRRARQRDIKDKPNLRRSPTPPLRQFAPESDFCLEDVNFDEDTTYVIQTPVLDAGTPRAQTDIQSWKPRVSSPVADSDASISILDLDAALGPLNTPNLGTDPEDTGSGGFPVSRRRMHSGGATGGFSGPGMHYHRRAESAPELVAINYHAFGFPRLSSNPAMADVFEEEEEEEENVVPHDEEAPAQHHEEVSGKNLLPGLGVKIVDLDFTPTQSSMRQQVTASSKEEYLGNDNVEEAGSTGSLRSEILHAEDGSVEIVSADEEPRASGGTRPLKESPIRPILSKNLCTPRPASAPIDFAMSRSRQLHSTPESSSCVSSPDFSRTSFEGSRMHTANSSITDRATLSSYRACDHGLSMRDSVDDVPSLTSSASTVFSAHPPRISSSAGTRSSGDRAPSLPAVVPRRARYESAGKRSSLASLSRLVAGSYGEKSKLSIEERAQPDNVDKTEKRKGNRITRLMRFWKSKEKAPSS